MNTLASRLTPAEEAFLQAVLWEESTLLQGPASRAAASQGLNLLRCLEVANRLSPNLQGAALSRLQQGPGPTVEWPWPGQRGPEVLRLLWTRLAELSETASCPVG